MSSASAPTATRLAVTEETARQLYAAHRTRLLAIARRNCSSSDDAEEALHDAFILFIERFDPESGSPALPWLMLTLKRRCWAIHRRRRDLAGALARSQRERAALRDVRSVEELAEIGERRGMLRSGLGALRPDERRVLALLATGHSYREIAECLGWTPKRVDHCLERARAKLRNRIGERPSHDQ